MIISCAKAWKIAEVIPILKSGNFEDPCNNRPISLLPILSKVSERLAHGQFVDYLTANKILAKTQSGNRKLFPTETRSVEGNFLIHSRLAVLFFYVLCDLSL